MTKSGKKPGKIARFILESLLPQNEVYYLIGDFEEEFSSIHDSRGIIAANLMFWRLIFSSLPGFLFNSIFWSMVMFKNFIKIALRNMVRNKGYSFINITGLSLGVACCLFIVVFVLDERSYDKHHENAENVYRIALTGDIGGQKINAATVAPAYAPTLIRDFPEIVNAARFFASYSREVHIENEKYDLDRLLYADNSFFDVFTHEFISGNRENALAVPNTVVLTLSLAEKYFGTKDAVGKIITIKDDGDFQVTAVVKDPPRNSHFTFQMLASFETLVKQDQDRWTAWAGFYIFTYLMFEEGTDYREFEKKFPEFNEKYIGDILKMIGGTITMYLQPLTDIHLHSQADGELSSNGNIQYVYAFSIIALFILLVACINFMNLSTARSANRAKEVGVRKVLGAFRAQLAKQFLGETFFITFIAFVGAVIIIIAAFPLFEALTGKVFDPSLISLPLFFGAVLSVFTMVGFGSGFYPALFLSSFLPVKVLKGEVRQGASGSRFRSIFVVIQFSVSIFLVIGTMIISDQLTYMREKDLGFDQDRLLVIELDRRISEASLSSLKEEILAYSSITNASTSANIPGGSGYYDDAFFPEGFKDDQSIIMGSFEVDDAFLKTYGIEILEGREFSREFQRESEDALIINKKAVDELGWEDPIGKTFQEFTNAADLSQRNRRTVVGVVEDFHLQSLRQSISPLYLLYSPQNSRYLTIKIKGNELTETVAWIETKWDEFFPDKPINRYFANELFNTQYEKEQQLSTLFRIFTMLALFIASLGLIGLTSFAVEKRTKEIGIRKALGASESTVFILMAKEYVKWLLIANIIAAPAAYYLMKEWMSGFAYQAGVGISTFIYAALFAALITLLTISYQLIKLARVNAVDSLRYE